MALSSELEMLQYVIQALVLLILYVVTLGVYRVYFSPLSHIPGPKFAAATRYYELWFDAVQVGKYYKEIERMHEKYGPIVRITPFEVHINDPSFFNELYSMTKKLHKDPWYYLWLDRDGSSFATINPDLHKLRSTPIKKGLSPASISRVEHVMKEHFGRLIRRIEEFRDKGKPVPMTDAYRALAIDVVSDISCPSSMALLDTPDLGHDFHEHIRVITMLSLWNRQFPIISKALNSLPRWVIAYQGQTALNIFDSLQAQKDQARDVIRNNGNPTGSKAFPVIMDQVYKSADVPATEKTHRRLFEEIAILIGAGSETTSHSLLTITYHVLANPSIHKRLQTELRDRFSEEERTQILSYKQLEPLPYLNAVITEGLRMATGVSGRLPRINKTQPTTYISSRTSTSYLIPAGCTVSMTIRDMHYHPACFPSPSAFQPERFLGARREESRRWFAPFGRGPRSCVGQNLAMAEMLMAVGNLFARFDVRLKEGSGGRMSRWCMIAFRRLWRGEWGLDLVVRR
ncbi:hypothetical protein N0V90_002412 [Kalmusia sp. IMI 367209]|nr:hypothetical protein N0V90_002412 [Kalmusia sp. IMI 367209]